MAKVRISRRKVYREALRTYVRMARSLITKLDKFSNKYRRYAFKEYAKLGEISNEYYDSYWQDLYKLMEKNAKTIIEDSSRFIKTSRMLKKAEDEVAEVTYDYITQNTAQNVTYITETTRKHIQSAIAYSVSEGLGQDDTAKQIAKSTAFSSARSKVIARTETHQAYNYGNNKIARRLALKKPRKEWLSALDTRTRTWHTNMNGRSIAIEEYFEVYAPSKTMPSPQLMQYTGDSNGGASNVVNCRCFTMYYDAEDIIIDK